ncbi:MAG: non-canonical purine NTP pyrophosphatase [Solirubrobacterales bacterium]|nr:non-canonical purine NTP pyrophosphatase [Solirubrobacterales bacterium]
MKLLLATHNEHKRRELERLLAGSGWQVDGLPEHVRMGPEDAETFAENALGKARAAAQATGRLSIADDSGIAAAALGGAPGVRSARYAGEQASDRENLEKLMREVPAGSALEYVCVIAMVDPRDGSELLFDGRCAGRMAAQERGEGGFGYDPVFVAEDAPGELTMAELSARQKDEISHRGRAARELRAWLEQSAATAG